MFSHDSKELSAKDIFPDGPVDDATWQERIQQLTDGAAPSSNSTNAIASDLPPVDRLDTVVDAIVHPPMLQPDWLLRYLAGQDVADADTQRQAETQAVRDQWAADSAEFARIARERGELAALHWWNQTGPHIRPD